MIQAIVETTGHQDELHAAEAGNFARRVAQLSSRHAADLERYAGRWSDAPQDVVQEAFLQLVRQKEMPHHAVPWLYRVARNRAISQCRARQRRNTHERQAATSTSSESGHSVELQLDAAQATAELTALPADVQAVIVSHLWRGMTFRQIGQTLGLSTTTAHRRYQAGLATLRRRLRVLPQT